MLSTIAQSLNGAAVMTCSAFLLLACTTGDVGDADAAEAPQQDSPSTDECPALAEGLVSLQMVSQGSHAAARHDLTVDFGTGKLTGESFDLVDDDPTPKPRPVDRSLTDDERAALLGILGGICHPVQEAKLDEHAAPGGSTVFEVVRRGDSSPLKLVFGQGASSLATGDRYVDLTRTEFSTLAESVPTR